MGYVPTIDLRDPDAAVAIDRACRDVGVFQIVGHGVDEDVEAAAWSAADPLPCSTTRTGMP